MSKSPLARWLINRATVVVVALAAASVLPLNAFAAPAPISAARFSITIDGYEIASFSELVSISTEVEPVDLLQGGTQLSRLPGKRKPPTIVLKRGKSASTELLAWHAAAATDGVLAARKNASLIMYSTDGTPVARYHLELAWPSKIEIGALKAGSSETYVETVTLVCEHIQRVAP